MLLVWLMPLSPLLNQCEEMVQGKADEILCESGLRPSRSSPPSPTAISVLPSMPPSTVASGPLEIRALFSLDQKIAASGSSETPLGPTLHTSILI